jgi:ferredoxin-NAD(P)+ reductase (naphthalene dioxygenase ferredoxin-specific)
MSLIHIAQWPQPVQAGRQRILEAALDAGVPFPHGCGSGECGSCKCELLGGEVRCDRYSPDALSDEERERGLILACRSRPQGDVRIRWLSDAAPLPMVKVDAVVASIKPAGQDVVVLTLQLPERAGFHFRPGQFAKLRFGKLPSRSYSMANQPGEGKVVFHIRVLPGGVVSQHVAGGLLPGDRVEVRGPFGDAYWQHGTRPASLLLLAGGTGLAPVLSVLDAALAEGTPSEQIHLYHGVRTPDDLYAGDLLNWRSRQEGFRFVPVYSDAGGPQDRTGYVHEAVGEDFAMLTGAMVHVAGPVPMVDAVRQLVTRRGVGAAWIKADPFIAAEPEKKSLWERVTGWGNTGFGNTGFGNTL